MDKGELKNEKETLLFNPDNLGNQLDWENKYLSQFETADPKITNGRYSGHLWQDDETGGYRLSDE